MIDFQELKAQVPITSVVLDLKIEPKTEPNGQLRFRCPACDTDDPRSVVVTPDRSLFYCFASKKGGDQIALYAHVKNVSMKQAAEELSPQAPKEKKTYDLDQYGQKLDPDHPASTALFPPNLAKELGAGFSHKGLMKGLVAIPIRMPDGKVIGYIGVTDAKVPKEWRV